jgi:hypothetical protein
MQQWTKGSKLIVIEPILGPANQKDMAKMMDVYMMAITGGKERTKEEFEKLLNQSGFTIDRVVATDTEFSIIEASILY